MMTESPKASFRDDGKLKTQRISFDRGITSTQESEPTSPRKSNTKGFRAQGEFSGLYDKKGHHLKSDGTPDMRFKENREDYTGKGFEISTKEDIMPVPVSPKLKKKSKESDIKLRGRSSKIKSISNQHSKGDGTPDMRYKENREQFSGKGYENYKTRSINRLSKSNMGLYEGNVPGEHSGKYDEKKHHLKNDGTPDMRFIENRKDYSGKGYEHYKLARYKQSEDAYQKDIYYRRKRPPTPYAIYIRERAPEMKRENPDMDMNEVFRELGQIWRNSSDKEHKKYYDMYDDEVRRWEENNKFQHKGALSMRKLAEKIGLEYPREFSKRGKLSSWSMRNKTKDEGDNKLYDPEENVNPNDQFK